MHSTLFRLASFQLAVTVLLAVVPCVSATSSPRKGLHLRDPVAQKRGVSLPPGWSSLGCYTDDPVQRTLTTLAESGSEDMSVELCVNICNNRGFSYAGPEFGVDCYCGHSMAIVAESAPSEDCNSTCAGDSSQICGGSARLSLYWSGNTPLGPLPP
ncbi:WSC domain-containing protein [Lactarius psammicola]|nr:WSC domain-containing protein [Lactarius psammicola]